MTSVLELRRLTGDVRVGSKVANLAALAKRKVPVPEGYVVSRASFDDWGRKGWVCQKDGRWAVLDAAAIWGHLPRLAPDPLVVRSAFDEDDNYASMAGAYLTRLDVPDAPEELPAAICDVWSSATSYSNDQHIMVMRQVRAHFAGVAASGGDYEDELIEYAVGDTTSVTRGGPDVRAVTFPRLELAHEGVPTEALRLDFAEPLAHALRRIRRVLGSGGRNGWDVEWAYDGTTCWILQVRPLTAPVPRREELTAANLRESYPDPPSPFTLSVLSETLDEAWLWFTRTAGGFGASRRWVFVRAGRPYTNQSALADLLRHLGVPPQLATNSAGGSTTADSPSPRRLAARPLRTARLLWRLGTAPRAARTAIADLREMSVSAPVDARAAVHIILAGERSVQRGMTPLVSLLAVVLAVSEAAGGPPPRTIGTPNDKMWTDLGKLHSSVLKDPAGRHSLVNGEPTGDLGRQWRRWLHRFGHRATWELDFAEPRYREDPSLILELLAGDTPPHVEHRPETIVVSWSAVLPYRLGCRLIMLRETLRDYSVRLWEGCRNVLLDAERGWVDEGRLPEVGALWMCTYAEVLSLCAGEFTMDAAELRLRRDAIALDGSCKPPLVLFSDEEACHPDSDLIARGTRLKGLVVSRGRAEGRAHLLRSPNQAVAKTGPYIAVIPVMSAGWVPAIAGAAGVVVESGGILSHGSILLRELGRCAVTNVRDVLSIVRDGDWLSIDGDTGTVLINRDTTRL